MSEQVEEELRHLQQERDKLQALLQAAHEKLEAQVKQRTAELTYLLASLMEQDEERQRAQAEANRRNLELRTLNSVTMAVNGTLELPEVLGILRQLLVEKLDISGGSVLLYDKRTDQLYLKASWGLPPQMLAELALFAVEGSPHAHVIRKKKPLLEEDLRQAPLFRAWQLDVVRPEWKSYMAIPILSKNKVQGVLCLYSQAPAIFDKSQVAFFENLGRQVGVAIQNARLFEQVHAGRERLRQLAQQVVVAQEEERHRVSRELHDEAGQALTVLKFSLEMVRTALPAEGSPLTREAFDSLRRHLADAVAMCDMTMTGIRQLAHDLRPAALDDLGLHPALEGFCHDFAERTGLIIKYVGGEPPPLPNAFRICFYRFLQEALTNVVRHAQARQVWIELRCTAHLVSLSVADDGQGFDKLSAVSEAGHEKGIGLAGMQERLESLGGRLEIVSQPGQGVRLAAHLPLPTEEASNG